MPGERVWGKYKLYGEMGFGVEVIVDRERFSVSVRLNRFIALQRFSRNAALCGKFEAQRKICPTAVPC